MDALSGRHALVTGAGSGIGAAIAAALAQAGAAVSIVGRRRDVLDAVATGLPKAASIVADVTREEDCAAMIAAAHDAFGPVDIVIPNAGAAKSKPFHKTDLRDWQQMIDVNLTGAFLTVKACMADVARERTSGNPGGRVVFIASTAGLKGYPYVASYCAAKHGVVGLARALAAEFARKPVTVNAICPGYTDTSLVTSAVAEISAKTGRSAEEARAELVRSNPQGRLIAPDEIAQTVLWLCSPAASSITGQTISISGGEI
jgi:NAD(P)-dependent dehydrogenase (short-subunit alcohol dehydrogenase family)